VSTRRAFLVGLGGLAVAGGSYALCGPSGGHIWLGHDDDIADVVALFVRQPSSDVLQ